MERGQGWREVDHKEYAYDTQLYQIFHKPHQVIEYSQPYKGDSVSMPEAARIVGMFPGTTRIMFIQTTERPEIFEYKQLPISHWRVWSTINDGEITQLRLGQTFSEVHVNVLKDDWFAVMVDYDRCFKCDQIMGLKNLIRDLLNK